MSDLIPTPNSGDKPRQEHPVMSWIALGIAGYGFITAATPQGMLFSLLFLLFAASRLALRKLRE